ncbi:PfkB family carbohydrate kinase [Streptomyces sp. M19]
MKRHVVSDLLVVGSVNLDEVYPVPELPGRGETVLSAAPARGTPGQGRQPVGRRGHPDRGDLRGAVGDDDTGEFLRTDLAAAGVDTTHLVVKPAPSGTAVVLVERGSGDNSIVVDQGANQLLDTGDIPREPLAAAPSSSCNWRSRWRPSARSSSGPPGSWCSTRRR